MPSTSENAEIFTAQDKIYLVFASKKKILYVLLVRKVLLELILIQRILFVLKMSSAPYIQVHFRLDFIKETNTMNRDQTAPKQSVSIFLLYRFPKLIDGKFRQML